ncbi:MAG: beta-galactosidase [Armatimonadetes bacterium]|nr:beta-galactosidase [Armatimonadota bacterium]
MHRWLPCLLFLCLPAAGANLLRNGSFELPDHVGTTRMLQNAEPWQYHWGDGKTMFISWQPLGAEAWWSVGVHPGPEHLRVVDDAGQAHTGRHALLLQATGQPVGAVCAAGQLLPAGPVTFSVWLRTHEAAGLVRFDALPDNTNMSAGFLQESATRRGEWSLPAESGWTRLSTTLDISAAGPKLCLAVRLQVTRGLAVVDDVQVEPGKETTPFEVRPAERVGVRFDHPRALPVFVAGRDRTAAVEVGNTGTGPLSGELTVSLARWDGAAPRVVLQRTLNRWPPDATLRARADLNGLRPDAYVLTARVAEGGQVLLDGLAEWDPRVPCGGTISTAMVKAPCVARCAVADSRPNNRLFGSGDMMLNTGGSWWGGYPMADYVEGRELGFGYSRERVDDDSTYRLAAGGMRSLGDGPRPWTAPADLPDALRNPVRPGDADLSNPAVWPYLERMWRGLAAVLKGNPIFPLVHITGEEMVLYQGSLCPTDAADADFRGWVQQRYGSLGAVSAAWGREVPTWESIEQVISVRMVREQIVKVDPAQEKRLDWLGAADKLNAEQGALLKADPGRGMDWLRWRSDLYVRSVERLAEAFHSVNRETLLCNHFCWPDFVPQTTFGLARRLDALGIDTQYPCGVPTSLGTPAETIDMMGLYESFADQKPVWGMEIYIQPRFPADMPATQIWGFIAHGMRVVNNFAWKPYSDAGLQAKRWNEPGAPPWWFVIDFDGTHMPQFDPLVKATREVKAFDARFDGAALQRRKPDAALFVSSDSGVQSHFETLGHWWESPIVHARCELGWLLRLNGVALDYLDEELLASRLKDYRTLFVPYSPSLSDAVLERLSGYAKGGGTLVLAGPSGRLDAWLKPRANVGGQPFAALGWKLAAYQEKPAEGVKGTGLLATVSGPKALAGTGAAEFAGGTALLRGADGAALGWTKSFGRGTVIALNVYPSAYTQSPHADPGGIELAERLADMAGVNRAAWWTSPADATPGRNAGEGAPVVDVMLRQKSERELFAFVMNVGGAGEGTVALRLPGSGWKLTNALTGERLLGLPGGAAEPLISPAAARTAGAGGRCPAARGRSARTAPPPAATAPAATTTGSPRPPPAGGTTPPRAPPRAARSASPRRSILVGSEAHRTRGPRRRSSPPPASWRGSPARARGPSARAAPWAAARRPAPARTAPARRTCGSSSARAWPSCARRPRGRPGPPRRAASRREASAGRRGTRSPQ